MNKATRDAITREIERAESRLRALRELVETNRVTGMTQLTESVRVDMQMIDRWRAEGAVAKTYADGSVGYFTQKGA